MNQIARQLADAASSDMGGKWSAWLDGDDGAQYRAKIEPDNDADLFQYGEMGKACEARSQQRPKGYDGAAVKVRSRSGMLWWQPPEDAKGDAEMLANIRERVEGYFLEHWAFVGVIVERQSAPCPHCGERNKDGRSLWHIESDAGEYFAEVIADLMVDLQPKVTE